MSSTPTAADPRTSNGTRPQHPPITRAGTPLPVRERRPAYVALAVVLIVGCAALGAYFYTQAGEKTPVVEVITHVAVGHTIQRSDLTTVDVAGAVTAVGGARLQSMVGRTAAVALLPHTLLQRAMVTDAPTLSPTQAQVGVNVKPGQIPADGLDVGDTVEVFQLPSGSQPGQSATASTLVDDAVVFASAADPSRSGGTLLTLVVPRSIAAAVASASNASLIALVRVSR